MERKRITQLLTMYTLLHAIHQTLLFLNPDIAEQTKSDPTFFLIASLFFAWDAWALWRDEDQEFSTFMEGKKMRTYMYTISAVVWIVMGFRFYSDFSGTDVYEEKMSLINGMVFLFILSIDIWIRVSCTRLIYLYIEMKNTRVE